MTQTPTPRFAELERVLKQISEAPVTLPPTEPHLELLLSARRTFWRGSRAQIHRPADRDARLHSNCHTNAARLFDANPEKVRIATGWACFPDHGWIQHSWGVSPDGKQVYETKSKAAVYVGVALSRKESESFSRDEVY